MTKTKYILLFLIITLLAASSFSFFTSTVNIFSNMQTNPQAILDTISLVSSQTLSAMAIVLGIHFITIQLSGRKPYEQIMEILYSTPDIMVFIMFLLFHVQLLIVYFSKTNIYNEIVNWSLVLVMATIGSYLSVLYYAVNIFQNFQPKYYLEKCIQSFTTRNTSKYNLVVVNSDFSIKLNVGGNQFHYKDPLISFHQILDEIIADRNRRVFNRFINLITRRVVRNLHGQYREIIGLREQRILPKKIENHRPKKSYITHLVHFLHYIVRIAKKIINSELCSEYRKTIVVNLGNLLYSLISDRKNRYCIEYLIYANYIFNLQFAKNKIDTPLNNEPLMDILNHSHLILQYDHNLYNILLKTLVIMENECDFLEFSESLFYDKKVFKDYSEIKRQSDFSELNFPNSPWSVKFSNNEYNLFY